ncbi:MAG: DUF188 domain-containing protein [Treponema sp.]|jgi:uncharacterized protein YaiI (UPF0178 family)|nr:DUF188 domain-containing protein [Treponema sp.]
MKILVDADSCPKAARDLVLRRAAKLNLRIIFAANRPIPGSDAMEMEICSGKENSADDRIVELAEKGDLAVTRDVPLAKRLVEKDVFALDDRGRTFNKENINEILSLRNFTVGLADNGLGIERTANYGKKELKTFADSLEKLLAKAARRNS